MNNEHNGIFTENEVAVELITKGAFIDDDPSFDGKEYLVETYVARLNHIALRRWEATKQIPEDAILFEGYTREELDAKNGERQQGREALEREIAATLGIDPDRAPTISRTLSEIFTIVTMQEVKTSE